MSSDRSPNRVRRSNLPFFKDEPLEDQLRRRLHVTIALTAITGLICTFILIIFTCFDRPDIGVCVAGVLLVPIVLGAWAEFLVFASRVDQAGRNGLSDKKNEAPPV